VVEEHDMIISLWESLGLICQLQLLLVNQGWQDLSRQHRPGIKTTESVYQDIPMPPVSGWTEVKREVVDPRRFDASIARPCAAQGTYTVILGVSWLSRSLLWGSNKRALC